MNKKVALQIRNIEPVEEIAKAMAESGFRYVAIAFSNEKKLLDPHWERYVNGLGETFAKHGLTCVQTHAPYYDLWISAEKRDADMETALLRSIEATKLLGAEICAVHPRSVMVAGAAVETMVDRERSLRENLISFAPLAEASEKRGILLGIENLMRYPLACGSEYPYFYSWMVEDHLELIDRLRSEHVAAVWDFGHANLVDTDHAARIRTLGSRIKGTHVHNNAGKDDNHFPPFIPEADAYYVRRTVDWESVLAALKETGFEGYLTLETVLNLRAPIKSYIQYLYDSVCMLDTMLQR